MFLMIDPSALVAIAAENEKARQREEERVQMMRENLTPEQFKEWQAEETAERRHRELCAAIRQSGTTVRTSHRCW